MTAHCVLEIGEIRVSSDGIAFHPTGKEPLTIRAGDDVELRVHYFFEETPGVRETLHLALNVDVGAAKLAGAETAVRDGVLRKERAEGTLASFAKFSTPGRVRASYRLEADAAGGKRVRRFEEKGEIEFKVAPDLQSL